MVLTAIQLARRHKQLALRPTRKISLYNGETECHSSAPPEHGRQNLITYPEFGAPTSAGMLNVFSTTLNKFARYRRKQ